MLVIRPCLRVAFVLAALIAVSVQAQSISYVRIEGVVSTIATGSDGNLWFATTDAVVKMTTAGQMTSYAASPQNLRTVMAAAPDGRMWFTNDFGHRIGAITMDGVITEYPLAAATNPLALTSGPDGRMWFGYNGGVGAMTTSGSVTLFPMPGNPHVIDIVEGADGNLWFVEYPMNSIGRITTTGVATHFATYPDVCCGPVSIARTDDGAMWLAFNQGDAIARVTTDGTIAVHPLALEGVTPTRVETGPDGRIWFWTEFTPKIGTIDEDGNVVQLITLASEVESVIGMTAGPDGNLWATLESPGVICTLGCPPPDPAEPPPLGIARINPNAAAAESIPTMSTALLILMSVVLAGVGMRAMTH